MVAAIWPLMLAVFAATAVASTPTAARGDLLITGGQVVDPRAETVAIRHVCVVGATISALWQQAGLPKWAILRAATTDLGDFLGIKLGVQPGDRGHLLVLRQDPTRNVANTRRLEAVVIAGHLIDRAAVLQWSRP